MKKYKKEQIRTIIRLKQSGTPWSEMPIAVKKSLGLDLSMMAIRSIYRKNKDTVDEVKEFTQPKVLILDIETAPIKAHVWSLWNNNVGLNQIVSDWHVMSWAAKWLHDDTVVYRDQRDAEDIEDDSELLHDIWLLLDEADIVVGQNSKNFDIKKLNARFAINGYPPPSTFRQTDTLELAKKYFGFTSNKLEYMTDKLCKKFKKLKHKKYPGHEMWTECLKGNLDAWECMEEYNKYDILSTEELYEILSAWDNTSINVNVFHDEEDTVCRCGSTEFVKHGYYYTPAGKYQKYRCTSCGHETRDNENLLSKDKRKKLRRNTVR